MAANPIYNSSFFVSTNICVLNKGTVELFNTSCQRGIAQQSFFLKRDLFRADDMKLEDILG